MLYYIFFKNFSCVKIDLLTEISTNYSSRVLPDIQVYLFLIRHASALKAGGKEDLTTVASFYKITVFKIKSLETMILSVLIFTINLHLKIYY